MNFDDMRVSRTEQKKARERLGLLATPLANLSAKKRKNLPVSAYFLDELAHLDKIDSAAAKNRQVKRIAKLIDDENADTLTQALFEALFDAQHAQKALGWLDRLNIQDDNTLKQFVKSFSMAEYNTLYQLLRWIEYAKHLKDDELLLQSVQDLETYVRQMAILSR